jgi:hypothetical protein
LQILVKLQQKVAIFGWLVFQDFSTNDNWCLSQSLNIARSNCPIANDRKKRGNFNRNIIFFVQTFFFSTETLFFSTETLFLVQTFFFRSNGSNFWQRNGQVVKPLKKRESFRTGKKCRFVLHLTWRQMATALIKKR